MHSRDDSLSLSNTMNVLLASTSPRFSACDIETTALRAWKRGARAFRVKTRLMLQPHPYGGRGGDLLKFNVHREGVGINYFTSTKRPP